MDEYNNKFNDIMEILTDMQIKDLMKFNSILENNEKIFQSHNFGPHFSNFLNISG